MLTREEKTELFIFSAYIGAHVLAYILGYLFGHFLFEPIFGPIFGEKPLSFLALVVFYVLHYFAIAFVGVSLFYVFEFFRNLNLFDPFRRFSFFSFIFLSHLVLITTLIFLLSFLDFWLSGWKFKFLYWDIVDYSVYALIYFTLPFGLSLFIMNLIWKALSYSLSLEEKAMVQGSQSSAVSSSIHKKVFFKPVIMNLKS